VPSLATVETSGLLTSYLGAYARRVRDPRDARPFPQPEPNLVLAFAHARLAGRLTDERARDGARAACTALVEATSERDSDALAAAIGGCATLEAGTSPQTRSRHGRIAPHVAAWRVLEAVLAESPEGDVEALAYLERRQVRGGEIVGPGAHGPKIAYVLGLAAQRADGPERERLRKLALGFLPAAAAAATVHDVAELSTLQAVTTAAAAAVNGQPDVARSLLAHLSKERLDGDRGLLWREPGGTSYELSPWVAIALAELAGSEPQIEGFYAPVAPDPPDFSIDRVEMTDDGLRLALRDPHGTATRDIRFDDLDDMLRTTVEQIEDGAGKDQPPRQHAHMAIALHSLWQVAGDDATRTRCEALAREMLGRVLDAQQDNGGWSYAAADVPSFVFTAAGATATTFPDLQYSIDAAVPGIALSVGSRWLSEPRYLDAAVRGLGFLEGSIGRLRWEGRRVWRLYPGDEKSARMGTAVNYELWNGAFFAELGRATTDRSLSRRLAGYIDDVLGYCEGHLRSDGGIGYGDYIREERMPYSAWDAYLLGRIGHAAERPAATEMGQRILARMEGQLLDCGALPNAWPYREAGPSGDRWVVHRHGIGPYPIRIYYQLYPTVAAASCGSAEQLAIGSFAFAWLQLREEVTGRMIRGYSGSGEFGLSAHFATAACWKIDAVAALSRLGAPYSPSLDGRRDAEARWRELVSETAALADDDVPATGRSAPDWLARVLDLLDRCESDDSATAAALAETRRAWLCRFWPQRDGEGVVSAEAGLEDALAFTAALRRAGRHSGDEAFDRYARTLLSRLLVGYRDALGRWRDSPDGTPLDPPAARRVAELLRELGDTGIDWLTTE
jgi:hypothetical protein